MNPSSAAPEVPSDRRAANRRTGIDRRAGERRLVVDRRYSAERRVVTGSWLTHEPPAEHVRNAMQLLVGALESDAALSPAEFTRLAESALVRLSLALDGLEKTT